MTDTQFAYGLTFPTPGTFWSTGGRPPFKPDTITTTDSNEPYTEVYFRINDRGAVPGLTGCPFSGSTSSLLSASSLNRFPLVTPTTSRPVRLTSFASSVTNQCLIIFLQCPRASRSVSVPGLPSSVSFGLHHAVNSELIILIHIGARGTSLMFSSGDGGVGDGEEDPALQECFTNDGRNATRFVPLFPPSCPLLVRLVSLAPLCLLLTHLR